MLSTLYQLFEDEFDTTFLPSSNILRNTDFYIIFEKNKIEVFVYPVNNFDFYLKSKGSLYRFSETKQIIEENGKKVEKYGYKVPMKLYGSILQDLILLWIVNTSQNFYGY
jgi:hypothetical protein